MKNLKFVFHVGKLLDKVTGIIASSWRKTAGITNRIERKETPVIPRETFTLPDP